MATSQRPPTSDISFTGTWSGTAGQRWTLVDDYPSQATGDVLTHGTPQGEGLFGFAPFTIPANAESISVQVHFYGWKNGSPGNSLRTRIRSGAVTADGAAAITNLGNGIAAIAHFEQNFTNDPATGSPWTVTGINSNLNAFGIVATDANPTISITSIEVQVTWSVPLPTVGASSPFAFWLGSAGIGPTLTPVSQTATVSVERLSPVQTGLTGHLTATWVNPTLNVDGSPLGDLAGVEFSYDTVSHAVDHLYATVVPLGVVTSYLMSGLITGVTYYASVRAFDTATPTPNYSAYAAEFSGVAVADMGLIRLEASGLLTSARTITVESTGSTAEAVSQTATVGLEALAPVSSSRVMRHEAVSTTTSTRAAQVASNIGVSIARSSIRESLQSIATPLTARLEWIPTITASRMMRIEALGFATVSQEATMRFEVLANVPVVQSGVIRLARYLSVTTSGTAKPLHTSTRSSVTQSRTGRTSTVTRVTQGRITPLSRVVGVSKSLLPRIEAFGFQVVSQTATVGFESVVGPTVPSPLKTLTAAPRIYIISAEAREYLLTAPIRTYLLVGVPEGQSVALSIEKQPSETFSYTLEFGPKLPPGRTLLDGTLFVSMRSNTASTTLAELANANATTVVMPINPGVGALLIINPLMGTEEKVKVSAVTPNGPNFTCTVVPPLASLHNSNEQVTFELGVSEQVLISTVATIEPLQRTAVLPHITRGVSGKIFRLSAVVRLDNTIDFIELENDIVVLDA